MAKVVLAKCPDYQADSVARSVEAALAPLGGMINFVRPGQKVLLKVSLLMPAGPGSAIVTHPEVVRAVVSEVKKAGGRPLIGDSCGSAYTDINEAYRMAGYDKVARETGAQLVSFSRSGTRIFQNLQNPHLPELHLFKAPLEADLVISLPKLKTHGLTLMTGAIKNLYGCVPGFYKARGHACAPRPDDFAGILVDILAIIKPRLTIMDAVYGMEGQGPSAGSPRKIGLILASPDVVAADAVAGSLIGYRPEEIDTTRLAGQRGLGESDLAKITVLGERIADRRITNFKKTGGARQLLHRLPRFVLGWAKPFFETLKVQPRIKKNKCTRCLICVDHCPVKAIDPPDDKDSFPRIDCQGCISCFCCQELCPARAIEAKEPWLLKLLIK